MSGEMRVLEDLLVRRIGLDPTSVGPQLIPRAVKQRMRDLKLDDLATYERQVRDSDRELQELIEEVVVAESWFFRDERPFEWLREYVRAEWLNAPARPPLRILSLACAAGEEPYSVAITLAELGLPARRYSIVAFDVSARRLALARRGVYSLNAFRGSDVRYRARHFRAHAGGYELDPSIRATVQFFQGSVLDPALREGLSPYDVIFCRNLLIYLVPSARVALLAVIDRLLAPSGVLLIGHADRFDSSGETAGFTAIGEPGCFAYRRSRPGAPPTPPVLGSLELPLRMANLAAPAVVRLVTPGNPPDISLNGSQASDAVIAGTEPPRAAGASPLLDQAAELANCGRFAEAIAECERHVRQKGLDASPFHLMGVIYQASGNRQRAEECFQKAVYLDPTHDEALLALALLAERRGDEGAALSFRRRAERTIAMSRKRVN
jgi:chemotaxis protein methyltransferase WspC